MHSIRTTTKVEDSKWPRTKLKQCSSVENINMTPQNHHDDELYDSKHTSNGLKLQLNIVTS